MSGRRGNLLDIPFLMIMLFIFAVGIFVLLFTMNKVNTQFAPLLNNPTSTTILSTGVTAIKIFVVGFVMFFVFSLVATIISAFFIRSHPVFFVVSTFLLLFFMIPTVILLNTFEQFKQAASFNALLVDLPLIEYVMDHLPLFFGISFLVVITVLFLPKLFAQRFDQL